MIKHAKVCIRLMSGAVKYGGIVMTTLLTFMNIIISQLLRKTNTNPLPRYASVVTLSLVNKHLDYNIFIMFYDGLKYIPCMAG